MRNRSLQAAAGIMFVAALTALLGCGRMPGRSAAVLQKDEITRNSDADPGEAMETVEQMPVFGRRGGLNEFRRYVMENMNYPLKALEHGVMGDVVVEFVIGEDGWIDEARAIESASPLFSEEVLRVMMHAPRWTPGKVDGEPVRVRFYMTVVFSHRDLPITNYDGWLY